MDEVVRRAMARWPNVPAVCGWLRLDRRGNWLLRLADAEPVHFDRVTNPLLIDFIGRNYMRDEVGRYYFQNGPQRVYASLDYAPWIARLDDMANSLVTHTGVPVKAWAGAYVDEEGSVVLETALGPMVLLDRDLPQVVDTLAGVDGATIDAEAFFDRIIAGGIETARMLGRITQFESIRSADMEGRLGFVRVPVP